MEKPHKEKRGRFHRDHGVKAKLLADSLRDLRRSFPGFASRIDQFIATVESDSTRSRKHDREKVVGILREWDCGVTVKELMEDTGYSHWDIRQILTDLMKRGIVVERQELRDGSGACLRYWVTVYRLAQITRA